MKCHDAEKLMLLQQSGCLSDRKIGALAAHRNQCPACAAFHQALTTAQSTFARQQEPPVRIVQNILREARTNAPEKKKYRTFVPRPALAMAASVFILLGLLFTAYRPGRVGMEMIVTEAQLLNTEDQIASVLYSGLSEDDLAFNFFMTYEGNGQG